MSLPGSRALAAARAAIGTPYLPGASIPGAGCDCAGLIEIAARAEGLEVPPRPVGPPELSVVLARYLRELPGPAPCCVVALARVPGGPAVHLGMLDAGNRMIHAHWTRGVVENRFAPWFAARVAAAFGWPACGDQPLPSQTNHSSVPSAARTTNSGSSPGEHFGAIPWHP